MHSLWYMGVRGPVFKHNEENLPTRYRNVGIRFGGKNKTITNTGALTMTYANLVREAKVNLQDLIRRKRRAIEDEVRAVQRRNASALKAHNDTLQYYAQQNANRRTPSRYNPRGSPNGNLPRYPNGGFPPNMPKPAHKWTNAEIAKLANIIRREGQQNINSNRTRAVNLAQSRAKQSYSVLKPPSRWSQFRDPYGLRGMMGPMGFIGPRVLTQTNLRARNELVLRRRRAPQKKKRWLGLF
jgi:hypothetical protein